MRSCSGALSVCVILAVSGAPPPPPPLLLLLLLLRPCTACSPERPAGLPSSLNKGRRPGSKNRLPGCTQAAPTHLQNMESPKTMCGSVAKGSQPLELKNSDLVLAKVEAVRAHGSAWACCKGARGRARAQRGPAWRIARAAACARAKQQPGQRKRGPLRSLRLLYSCMKLTRSR